MSYDSDPSGFEQFRAQSVSTADRDLARANLAGLSQRLKADLVSSKPRLFLSFISFSLLGYLVSLAICEQSGVGLSPISARTFSFVMGTMPHPWCAVLCGSLFSGIPFAITFLAFNRFQRRYLIFRAAWLPVLVAAASCLLLMSTDHEHIAMDWGNFHFVWLLTAIVTPYIFEAAAYFVFWAKRLSRP
jgi:hypothetical protein